MKAIDWIRFFMRQRSESGKQIFSVTELANAAGLSAAVINVQLGRLVRQGAICRYVPGRYGLPDAAAAEDLVVSIDPDAYVTAAAAAARHGLITQVPQIVDCFTSRRHNRSRTRPSPLGTLVFRCVSAEIHDRPDRAVAGPSQAICDLVYLAHRAGTEPRSLYTFRKLATVDMPAELLARYPKTVQADVRRLVDDARTRDPREE